MKRYLDTTNALRKVLGEEPLTEERLQRHGVRVVRCD